MTIETSSPRATAAPATLPVPVIVNPVARGGAAKAARAELERELARRGVVHQRLDSAYAGHATELAFQAARAGAPMVVAVGGDGTVHEVANGLLRAQAGPGATATALAVVPCGTGNDFATMIAGVNSREAAYDALQHRYTRVVDVGLVRWGDTEEYFVNAMGTGIDVEVVRQLRRNSTLPAGIIYLSALARALMRFRPVALQVSAADTVISERVFMAAICNGRRIGGAFRICPASNPDDGRLDACIVGDLSWYQIPPTVLGILRGTHADRPRVRMLRSAEFTIELPSGTPLFAQLDGELRDTGDARTLYVSTRASALRIVAAPDVVAAPETEG